MSYLVDTTHLKKKFCKHTFKIVYPKDKKKPLEICRKCNLTRTLKVKNKTLIPYLASSTAYARVLAFKPSIAILAGVVTFVESSKLLTNWEKIRYQGWRLPATKGMYSWCGLWHTIGCLNYKLHQKLGKGKRVYIKQYQRSCYRLSCKACYPKAIARLADRGTKRIENYEKKTGMKSIHLMLLPPPSQFDLPYDKLHERMMKILKMAQWKGGAVIFHPFKKDKKSRDRKIEPHFHLVGFGTKAEFSKAYGKFGWYIKDGGERRSVFQTFCYLLSHCGIKEGKHSVIWVGELSYRKGGPVKEKQITCCPVCEGKFVPVSHDGVHPVITPERPYQGLVDDDGKWHTD